MMSNDAPSLYSSPTNIATTSAWLRNLKSDVATRERPDPADHVTNLGSRGEAPGARGIQGGGRAYGPLLAPGGCNGTIRHNKARPPQPAIMPPPESPAPRPRTTLRPPFPLKTKRRWIPARNPTPSAFQPRRTGPGQGTPLPLRPQPPNKSTATPDTSAAPTTRRPRVAPKRRLRRGRPPSPGPAGRGRTAPFSGASL